MEEHENVSFKFIKSIWMFTSHDTWTLDLNEMIFST